MGRITRTCTCVLLVALLSLVLAQTLDDAVPTHAGPVVPSRTIDVPRMVAPGLQHLGQATDLSVSQNEAELARQVQARALAALHHDLWLHGAGAQLYTAWNGPITLKAMNWYGFEYAPYVPDGLERAPLDTILASLRSLGFNSLRLTFSNETVERNPVVTAAVDANPRFRGMHSLDIMQAIIQRAHQFGVRVILCNSRSEAGRGPELLSGMWYTKNYPESAWVNDWLTLAKRFRTLSAFVGADLRNEPHITATGTLDQSTYFNNGPIWGAYQGQYYHDRDWHYAAQTLGNALLSVNPNLLIIVEGVQMYLDPDKHVLTGGLWGSNLVGAQYDPIVLSRPSQLVYSVHEYGPAMWQGDWFSPSTTYARLEKRWNSLWGYLLSAPKLLRAPILVGEFGTCHNYVSCVYSSQGWKQGFWFKSFVRYLHEHPKVSWAYWALNPTGPFHPTDVDYYSLFSQDWQHYFPLVAHALAPLLSEPDGVWDQPVPSARVLSPVPSCLPASSCTRDVDHTSGSTLTDAQVPTAPARATGVNVIYTLPYVLPADRYRIGDLYVPKTGSLRLHPAVVLVHGDTWSHGRKGTPAMVSLATALAWHGYVAFDIAYRLLGEGGAFPNDIQDVKDAIAYLTAHANQWNIDPSKIVVVGSDAGAYLAMMAAYAPARAPFIAPHYPGVQAHVAAAASFYGPSNLAALAQRGGESPETQSYLGATFAARPDVYKAASPSTYINDAVPTIFFHGVADTRAPFGQTYRLYLALRQRTIRTRLVDLPGSPHGLAALRGSARTTSVGRLTSFLDSALYIPPWRPGR